MNRLTLHLVNHCRFAFVFLLSFVTLAVCGQTRNSTISIYNAKGDTMYSDKANAVAVVSDSIVRKDLLITVNQGWVYSSDKQLYVVDSLKNGRVVLSAFRIFNGKKKLLAWKTYIVVASPEKLEYDKYNIQHGFNLVGFPKGEIPISILRKTDRISLADGVNLESATVYLTSGKEGAEPYFIRLDSLKFPDYFLETLAKIKPGLILLFDEVKLQDQSGRIILLPYPIEFKVIAD